MEFFYPIMELDDFILLDKYAFNEVLLYLDINDIRNLITLKNKRIQNVINSIYKYYRIEKFYHSITNNEEDEINNFLNHQNLLKYNETFIFLIGIKYNNILIIKKLIKKVNPAANDNYAIQVASENGHFNVVELLLTDIRVDPSANNNFAIRYASENGHYKVVELLLKDMRVDPSADNNEAIRYASSKGHTEVVKILLRDTRVNKYDIFKWALENNKKMELMLLRYVII